MNYLSPGKNLWASDTGTGWGQKPLVFLACLSQHGTSALWVSWDKESWGPSIFGLPSLCQICTHMSRAGWKKGAPTSLKHSPAIQPLQIRVGEDEKCWLLDSLSRIPYLLTGSRVGKKPHLLGHICSEWREGDVRAHAIDSFAVLTEFSRLSWRNVTSFALRP